ncbi:TPA: hypothetical protein JG821_004452 [Vibrio parahaemolyticus]|nr:hypothetical protein [Vibrio parahaemolyticus]MBE4422294.1 hypothetical protein [Vibrio parahaemolyticus]TOJ09836.1 hypothetical protein CGI45_24060 [Vibrio parahaemolyticus]HAS6868311.1 hypothetical protein [Vibrio parahaemolyticus]HAV1516171.1 hypothetical protein [Vibrio parahaemolyticus]
MMEFIVSEYDKNHNEYLILQNDEVVYQCIDSKSERFEVTSGSEVDLNARGVDFLFNSPVKDFPKNFSYEGEIEVDVNCLEPEIYVEVNDGFISISYSIQYDLDSLTTGNIGQFLDEVHGLGLGANFDPESEIDHQNLTIKLWGESSSAYDTIADCLNSDLSKIKDIDSYICRTYVDKSIEDVFVSRFNFPKDYKVLCTQYLQWFGELLSNLNLDADVWTEVDGVSTKLMVSYKKDPALLEKIEQVFYQYLQLPYMDISYDSTNLTPEQHYFITSLQNQIDDYQAKVKSKDNIISYLQALNQDQVIKIGELENEKLLLIDSAESKDKIEKYSIMKGFINIDRIQPLNKNKTISLDLALIFGHPKSN